jgi:8-oxo-dGTP diphosphatase
VDARRRYPARPLVGVGAVIRKAGKVLLILRRRPPNAGMWSLPGGLVELGETTAKAVEREVKEETNLRVRVEDLLFVGTELLRDSGGRVEYHFVLIDFTARPIGGRVKLNAESSSFGWFSADDIKRLNVTRGTREVLNKISALNRTA